MWVKVGWFYLLSGRAGRTEGLETPMDAKIEISATMVQPVAEISLF